MRILCLGDSYTIGESVELSENFPAQLANELRSKGIYVQRPWIIAQTGWTTAELDVAIDAQLPEGKFDLVTLLIGVNDQYRSLPLETEQAGFTKLLDRAIGFAGGDVHRVIVISIPDWGVMPFAEGRNRAAIAQEIDQFNKSNEDIAAAKEVSVVDITPISRLASKYTQLIADDGLHPSAAQYEQWVKLIAPVAQSKLEQAH